MFQNEKKDSKAKVKLFLGSQGKSTATIFYTAIYPIIWKQSGPGISDQVFQT